MSKAITKRGLQAQPKVLKGWQQIAAFLGEPQTVVQRWAAEGKPIRKQGRYVETTPGELKQSAKGFRIGYCFGVQAIRNARE